MGWGSLGSIVVGGWGQGVNTHVILVVHEFIWNAVLPAFDITGLLGSPHHWFPAFSGIGRLS